MTDIRSGFKILTHDWRAPLQGGDPLCDGVLPVTLPAVHLDTSENECGATGGYHYSAELHCAASIAGFWKTGRPARCLVITAAPDAIQRGDKRRSSSVTLDRLCSDEEIQAAMRALVAPWAGKHADALVAKQWAWYVALGRPLHDEAQVEEELRRALDARGLKWSLKRYDSAWNAWNAWNAWDARNAWNAWNARNAWDAWNAWNAWNARNARNAWNAWNAWDAWNAWNAWDARNARNAWNAWNAWNAGTSLAVASSVQCGWLKGYRADQYTVGIRDAYHHGLAIALPTGKDELGWLMDEKP